MFNPPKSIMLSSTETPFRIGLTGGIGCGKSTVLDLFRRLGIPCFEADRAGASCYDDEAFCQEVVAAFGKSVERQDGGIDKVRLADIVFNDAEALCRLNAMVHPRVEALFLQWASEQDSLCVVFESAILYEYGFDRLMHRVVCVYLDQEERMRRLLLRDHTDRQHIERRMANQIEAEVKMQRADYVILNYEGNPRERQVKHFLQLLQQDTQKTIL